MTPSSPAPARPARSRLEAGDKVDYSEFHELLLKRRSELLAQNVRDREQLERFSSVGVREPGDDGDLSVLDENSDLALQLADRDRTELLEVRRALAKIHQGTYGKCEKCGAGIPAERLRSQPHTRYCIDDQSSAEAFEKAHRTPLSPKL